MRIRVTDEGFDWSIEVDLSGLPRDKAAFQGRLLSDGEFRELFLEFLADAVPSMLNRIPDPKPVPPDWPAVRYAARIALTLGIGVPQDALRDRDEMTRFVEEHLVSYCRATWQFARAALLEKSRPAPGGGER